MLISTQARSVPPKALALATGAEPLLAAGATARGGGPPPQPPRQSAAAISRAAGRVGISRSFNAAAVRCQTRFQDLPEPVLAAVSEPLAY
jgi:hypothetical protein